MKYLLTGLALALLAGQATAQQYLQSPPAGAIVIYEHPTTLQGKPEAAPAPKAVPAPVVVKTEECKVKTCVLEPKKNTKTVYSARCKEYCVRLCSFGKGHGCGDCGSCSDCGSCEMRTRNVLVKKTVPACDTQQCVLKEVAAPVVPYVPCPVPCPPPCPPAGHHWR